MSHLPVPPRPDPLTGRPRPPDAPLQGEPRARDNSPGGAKLDSPNGRGPALAWLNPRRRDVIGLIAVSVGLPVFTTTLIYITITQGLESELDGLIAMLGTEAYGWMPNPLLWLPALVAMVAFAAGLYRKLWLAAGADWLRYGNSRVDTYELVRVSVNRYSETSILLLIDSGGSRVSIDARALMRNRDLWNLVYNGILHSVAYGGAAVDARTRALLQLDQYPQVERPVHRSWWSTAWWAVLGFVSLGMLTPVLAAAGAWRLRSWSAAALATAAALPLAGGLAFFLLFVPDAKAFFQESPSAFEAWVLGICGIGQVSVWTGSMFLVPLRRHVLDLPRMSAARVRFAELRRT
ncbi:hypothetical protein [Actinomadura sp. 9N407]|uniref:hypothetical protein n=1 Tax=Actinomadura sp. 9N407 TaxID=3375154 RepID=UPI0037A574EB